MYEIVSRLAKRELWTLGRGDGVPKPCDSESGGKQLNWGSQINNLASGLKGCALLSVEGTRSDPHLNNVTQVNPLGFASQLSQSAVEYDRSIFVQMYGIIIFSTNNFCSSSRFDE